MFNSLKKIIFCSIFVSAQLALANSPEDLFAKVSCKNELKLGRAKLFDFKKTDLEYSSLKWLPVIEYKPFQKIFRQPIDIGKWIEIEFDTDLKTAKIYQVTEDQIVEAAIDKKCKLDWKNSRKTQRTNLVGENLFTDEGLKKLIQESQTSNVMLYVFSPRMIYSMTEAHVIQKIAQQLKIKFVPIYSFDQPLKAEPLRKLANVDELTKAPRLESFHLKMLSAEEHFPTLFFIKNGNLSSRRVHGVMPEIAWKQVVQSQF